MKRFGYLLLVVFAFVIVSCSKEEKLEGVHYDSWDVEVHAIEGNFSVAADKQVQFSSGNVQYFPLFGFYRTAENQYATAGESNGRFATNFAGWVDLFGWGTGNNLMNTSLDTSDYQVFADWNAPFGSQWRTLNEWEWDYLLFYRPDAAKLRTSAIVCGTKGYLLLPDGWERPSGISLVADSYDYANAYDKSKWKKLEASGAVFLPNTGFRQADSYHPGLFNYWTSSSVGFPGYEGQRVYLEFDPSQSFVGLKGISAYCGLAVRLVRDI